MDFKKVFEILITEFQKNKIEFVLIGGHALSFAGLERTTVDIDFAVLLEQADIVDDIMRKYGYRAAHKTQDVANYLSQLAELGQVDFLFAHRKYALEILKRAELRNIFRFKIKVAKPEDLIGLKVQSSSNDPQRYHKDMADIEGIITANLKKLDLELVREYFKLFEREKELDEILEKTNEPFGS
ncbi:MAG: nucleotidyl transferase AbiEii/AbiGii toxin family protein [Elusimicrobiota bacterium]